MTRKHFEFIAETLNKAHQHDHNKNVVEAIAFDLSVKFQDLNPNFDQSRFVEAVTKQDKPVVL
tara:strand:+ start:520 stop:708 length:189 start_codon:yes stop_codon:yes gene_type:complete